MTSETRVPGWAAFVALAISLGLAWPNFLFTGKWAELPGALNGARKPWYAAALLASTVLLIANRRRLGRPVQLPRWVPVVILVAGAVTLGASFFSRLPPGTWGEIPFQDDWTELFQQARNGVWLMRHGSVVGWNWWLLGGYPTSTDIAQSFALLGILPMTVLGDRVGYHVLHAIMFLSLPLLVWWDIRGDDRQAGLLAAGFAALLVAGYFVTLGNSGDTNSLAGAFSATIALIGSRAARLGRRWGGPVLLLGLTFALYSHVAFFVYAVIFLGIEVVYFRDRRAGLTLAGVVVAALVASLPVHWESLRYHAYVSFNNTVYNPGAPPDWARFGRLVYYNAEMLAFPQRWFNDYRSLANVWLPAILLLAIRAPRSRVGYYAWLTVTTQLLLRFNTPEAGAMFDRIQHMLPIVEAPALAGVVLQLSGTRKLAAALACVMGLYVATSRVPVPHLQTLRAFNPALVDRVQAADGMVLVEINPHRDMDTDPDRRTPRTPFGVHYEGLLPDLAGQRFYSQMIDGWAWNIWRGQIVAAGTFRGTALADTPAEVFEAEMRHWGVRHLFVWSDASRAYLGASGHFAERWREGLWSHFELLTADTRSVVTTTGSARLANLDFLDGDVVLDRVTAGEPVVVRTNFYPAWRASFGARPVALFAEAGQLAFRAPADGSYTVHLTYPRYRALIALAFAAFAAAAWTLWRFAPSRA